MSPPSSPPEVQLGKPGAKKRSGRDTLRAIYQDGVDEATALMRLAAFHLDSEQPMVPLRTINVGAGDQVFPAAELVPQLVALLLGRIGVLYEEAENDADEILIAVFAMYAITAIHPFPNANGHVAFDFGQYLLMKRWQEPWPVLTHSAQLHRVLGIAFAPLDRPCRGETTDDFVQAHDALFCMLGQANLDRLWGTSNLVAAAHFLAQATGLRFSARPEAGAGPGIFAPAPAG